MNVRVPCCVLACVCIPSITAVGQESGFPVLRGAYLGQHPPGDTPEVFAPGIISTDAHEGASPFSSDGRLFLFARAGSSEEGIFMMELEDDVWSRPRLAAFSAGEHDWDFSLSPDGMTVFVASGRPVREGGPPVHDHSIWVSKRIDAGWSEPLLLPFPINAGHHDSYPSVTNDGTLYFFSRREGGLGSADIYVSVPVDGRYTDVHNIGEPVNSEHDDLDPFIAPDESYIIFCSDRPGGYGNADLYVAFRNEDGSWTEPDNMGEQVNSPHREYIPSVTPDGRYFFFTSNKPGNRDIYWVDARTIEELRSTVSR